MEQFVATFHRFCGDDESFFVATLTSRPVGLETAFSIQLADKQPVLRGLCIVLDAWATPDNRYKRPGIRLGIKRLTAESQLVFDRLKAASKSPGVLAEATPPPGPLPAPPVPAVAPVLRPPAFSLRTTASPPSLPRLNVPRAELPEMRSTPVPAISPPVHPPPVIPALPAVPPRPVGSAPLAVEARSPAPPNATTLPAAPRRPATPVEVQQEAIVPAPGPSPEPGPLPESGASPDPTPVAVTRFQVALRVGTIPPPIRDVEFRPTPLLPRARSESKIISDPPPGEAPVDPGTPALIVDRPRELGGASSQDTMPNVVAAEPAARAPDPALAAELVVPAPDPALAGDLRTPGSALVLPANPLQNLSDESLEGFVDCTIYEESGNFLQAGTGGEDQDSDHGDHDEPAEPPAPSPKPPPPARASATPFDTPPPPAAEPYGAPARALSSTAALFAPLHDERATSATPWLDAAGATYSGSFVPEDVHTQPVPPGSGFVPGAPPMAMSGAMPAVMPAYGHGDADPGLPAYPAADASQYAHYPAPPVMAPQQVVALPGAMLGSGPGRMAPAWQRWLLICGTVTVAIVIAFMVARLARGSNRAEPAVVATGGAGTAPRTTPAPGVRPAARAGSGSATGSGTATSHAVAHAPEAIAADEPAGSPDPSADPVLPEEDGEAGSGGTPVVGSGPCRFTVATTPAGSLIRIDDQAMGPSPLTIEGTCDKHKVEVSHARYQTVTKWVTLVADKPQELEVGLPRPVHAVTVTSFPPGAELSIDGHRAGTTPTVVQVMGFAAVNLTFTKAGFRPMTKKIYSKLAQDRVFVKLTR